MLKLVNYERSLYDAAHKEKITGKNIAQIKHDTY